MTDILNKNYSLRTALAQAIVRVSSQDTINTILQKKVPKGDVFEFARAAGLLAIKKTSDVIPDCHPLPVEQASIHYEIEHFDLKIFVKVSTIYKTGVEVEAMHGASITTLTIYDMLKPIDKKIEIQSIKLIEKSGGKNDFYDKMNDTFTASVVVCSDSVFKKEKEDKAGKEVVAILNKYDIQHIDYAIIPDEDNEIKKMVENNILRKTDLLIFVGGTGLSPRDRTPDVIKPMIEREIQGMMEAARVYGQQRTPYAMLSRGVAGFIQSTLVMTLPGSTKGARESMQALFPASFHLFKISKGKTHDIK